MRTTIRQFFVKEGIATGRIVVAVSGGFDSTALLIAMHELELDIVAAHVNHRLRGAESDADEQFVRDLCGRRDIPLHVADGTLDPERVKARGIEAAAREVRYAALARIREEVSAAYVATAHQKNDQAETVLMRLMTGSGIAGLRGIHPHRADGFLRPLLGVTRAEIEAFLAERDITPRIDRSNEDPRFLRNRVRAFLRDGDAIENLAHVAEQAREQWPILEKAIDAAEDVEVSDDATIFRSWPEHEWLRGALLQRHIRRLDPHARDFDAARIARSEAQRISVTKNLELLRRGSAVILRKRIEPVAEFEFPLHANEDVYLESIRTTLHLRQPTTDHRQQFELPAHADLRFTVRNRRRGDRFQPLGMSQPKKLKDFLIDRKIDAGVRDRIPLLVWNGEIVWVAGVEVSERFKVRGAGGVLCEVWIDERDTATGLQR